MDANILERWNAKVEELVNLVYIDEKLADDMATCMLQEASELFGAASAEVMKLKYHIGIIKMLLNLYDEAESFMLSSMQLAEALGDMEQYALAVKYLSVLYEAKRRQDFNP